MTLLAAEGRVLGIDVGYSPTQRTTCFCTLEWTQTTATIAFELATSNPSERSQALTRLNPSGAIAAVAIDGPLANGLVDVTHYRAAEAILSRGILQKRGKPGQTSSPVGRQLHQHATSLARMALDAMNVASATHARPIHSKAIVEAFPNMYLAALVPERDLPVLHRDASDRYWDVAVRHGSLDAVLHSALPSRVISNDIKAICHHEHRAGLVCALTALSVASGAYVAVGDDSDGDIVLPARSKWGAAIEGDGVWLEPVLRANLKSVKAARRCHENHRLARIVVEDGQPNIALRPTGEVLS